MRIEDLAAYEIISRQKIHDLRSEGYLLRHKKSGARIALLSNDDENKVFYIGFRTPPPDSTGVAHILEHSVLCGSKEFPVKGPFCGAGKGISEYVFECHDLSGQDDVSGCKLQRQGFSEPDACLYGCSILSEYL